MGDTVRGNFRRRPLIPWFGKTFAGIGKIRYIGSGAQSGLGAETYMKIKVLLVEDDRNQRTVMAELIAVAGYQVLTAADGEQALEMFGAEKPAIVVSDVLIPKLKGFELCRAIKDRDQSIPVILFSAFYKTVALQQDARKKYGADEYLVKPFKVPALLERIEAFVGKPTPEEPMIPVPDSKDDPAPPLLPEGTDSGSFSVIPAPLVLSAIYVQGRTGVLACKGKSTKNVYFDRGIPRYVTSDDPDEEYCSILSAEEKLTTEQRAQAAEAARDSGRSLGQQLISMEIVTARELSECMLAESRMRLNDLIIWNEGTFRFVEDPAYLKNIKRPAMNFPRALYRAVPKSALAQFAAGRYDPRPDAIVHKLESGLQRVPEVEMEPEDLVVFALVDGDHSIAAIIEETQAEQEQVYLTLLTLELLGIVEV
jgi:CheY-like chemotaxis protein